MNAINRFFILAAVAWLPTGVALAQGDAPGAGTATAEGAPPATAPTVGAPSEEPAQEAPATSVTTVGPGPVGLLIMTPGTEEAGVRAAVGTVAETVAQGLTGRRLVVMDPYQVNACVASQAAADHSSETRCAAEMLAQSGVVAGIVARAEASRGGRVTGGVTLLSSASAWEPVAREVTSTRREVTAGELGAWAEAARELTMMIPAPTAPTTLLVAVNAPGAIVLVDGEAAGEAPLAPLPMQPGTHQVEVLAEGFEPMQGQVQVTAGAQARFDAVLKPTAEALEAFQAVEEKEETSLVTSWPLWTGVGGAVVVAVVIGVAVSAGGGQSDPDGIPVPAIVP